MPRINEKTSLALCLALCLIQIAPLNAAEDTSASIFKFQQAMAQKGHAPAQYKLAMMYETGDGVEQNLEIARSWYKQAAKQAYKPASHRLTYLDVAQTHNPADRDWLKELHKDAQSGEGEAMLLLGQMYATGTGITQELTLASRYLRRAAGENIPNADAELAKVEAALANKRAENQARAQQQAEEKRLSQQKADAAAAEKQRIQHILLQKQLADAKLLRQQQALAAQQRRARAEAVTLAKAPALVNRQIETPSATPGAEIKVDMSPCSGRNRFASTCR